MVIVRFRVKLQDENIWLNRKQLAELFDRDVKSLITIW